MSRNPLRKYFNLLKNFCRFNKYTNNFLFCQIYLKLFFVNLITSIFHHLLFHIYLCNIRNIFYTTKFIFKKLFKIIGVRLSSLLGRSHNRFYYLLASTNHLICCGRRIRTSDLVVMSHVSYLCSIPRY